MHILITKAMLAFHLAIGLVTCKWLTLTWLYSWTLCCFRSNH